MILAILLVWLLLLLWPDDTAESDWHGSNRFEARWVRLAIARPVGGHVVLRRSENLNASIVELSPGTWQAADRKCPARDVVTSSRAGAC